MKLRLLPFDINLGPQTSAALCTELPQNTIEEADQLIGSTLGSQLAGLIPASCYTQVSKNLYAEAALIILHHSRLVDWVLS